MSSVCHLYVLVCHPYVTHRYSYVTRMSVVCTRMSSVCHSSVILPWSLQKQQLQKTFSPVCLLLMQVSSINVFIPCDYWDTCLLYMCIVIMKFSSTTLLIHFLKEVIWKKFVFYFLFSQEECNANTRRKSSKITFQNEAAFYNTC